MPLIAVISREWDLRGAVRAELRNAGVTAYGLETVDDLGRLIASGIIPNAIVVDGTQLHDAIVRDAIATLAALHPVLVVDSHVHPAPRIQGAQLLSRPVQVRTIVDWVLAHARDEAA